MKNNLTPRTFTLSYLAGFFAILALPLLDWWPWFSPSDWGKTLIFRSIMAVLLLLFAYQFFFKREQLSLPSIKNNKVIWILTGLFGVLLLSSIFSVDPYLSFWSNPIRSGGFINFAFYILFAIFIFLVAKEHEWKKFWDISILVGVAVSVLAIMQYFGVSSFMTLPADGRPTSTIGNPIFLGIYLLLLLFLTLSFLIQEKRTNYKIFYGATLLLFLYVILITGSRAAYLGLLVGAVYFVLLYPKKLVKAKIGMAVLLLLAIGMVGYVNISTSFPAFLESNTVFKRIAPRLSVKSFLSDARFPQWAMGTKAVMEKPVLGYGMENYSVGFNKHYNPSAGIQWWDRAHNILLQTASDGGLLALAAYLLLFIVVFLRLQKVKTQSLAAHGIQATLIAYLVANFFSIDAFPSYLMFFMLIGYSLHLTSTPSQQAVDGKFLETLKKQKRTMLAFLLALVVWFLWQYNWVPLQINQQINIAQNRANAKKCDQAVASMDAVLARHSTLDTYARLKYIDMINSCAVFYPQNQLAFAKKGIEIEKELVKIQPLYVRSWIFLAGYTNVVASTEKDAAVKSNLLQEANSYLAKAATLMPNNLEILLEQMKLDLTAGNYQHLKQEAQDCIVLYPNIGECYWTKALAEIYLGNLEQAKQDMQTAKDKAFNVDNIGSLYVLANAYLDTKNYKDLAATYEKIIAVQPDIIQFHISLATAYSNIGEYKKAREQALIVLKLAPQLKDQVNAFLKTLPR